MQRRRITTLRECYVHAQHITLHFVAVDNSYFFQSVGFFGPHNHRYGGSITCIQVEGSDAETSHENLLRTGLVAACGYEPACLQWVSCLKARQNPKPQTLSQASHITQDITAHGQQDFAEPSGETCLHRIRCALAVASMVGMELVGEPKPTIS